jgi:hypothetical protein
LKPDADPAAKKNPPAAGGFTRSTGPNRDIFLLYAEATRATHPAPFSSLDWQVKNFDDPPGVVHQPVLSAGRIGKRKTKINPKSLPRDTAEGRRGTRRGCRRGSGFPAHRAGQLAAAAVADHLQRFIEPRNRLRESRGGIHFHLAVAGGALIGAGAHRQPTAAAGGGL